MADKRVLIFGGTTEGRELAAVLERYPVKLYLSVATEYGKECIPSSERIKVMFGRLDEKQIEQFLKQQSIDLVVDATHPFAGLVTAHIQAACQRCQVQYLRCLRDKSSADLKGENDKVIVVATVAAAVERLKDTKGNILIATGSKELDLYTAIPEYQSRCYARVLSTAEALEKSIKLGFEGKHLIGMQGPFSEALNRALLEHTKARYFVTKESGKPGGFEEKLRAAEALGVTLIVIQRPEEQGQGLAAVEQYIKAWLRQE